MKTLLPCELSSQSPSLPFIRQFYVKQELCGLRRMETLNCREVALHLRAAHIGVCVAVNTDSLTVSSRGFCIKLRIIANRLRLCI